MLPNITFYLLCIISMYALVRLGQVCDRIEQHQLERMQAAIAFEAEPPAGRRFLRDVIGAVLLSLLFLAVLILSFAI
ncbi:MAG: hypothetical protein V4662_13735 [Verrucomicrobiota bacterium]